MTHGTIEKLIHDGDLPGAIATLKAHIESQLDADEGHDASARLAELAGHAPLAVRAWQLHLRDHPKDLAAWEALAELHAERGDHARMNACRERLVALGGASVEEPAVSAEPATPPPGQPTDIDVVRFVDLFAGREDHHARMWHDPQRGTGYSPVKGPLTPNLVRAHLDGAITLGAYNLRLDGCVTWACLDLDMTKKAIEGLAGRRDRARELRDRQRGEALRIRDGLRAAGLSPLLEDSGRKGFHLWLFLPEPTPAEVVRERLLPLAGQLAPRDPDLSLEVFPKQDGVRSGGLGNLVKLPLGVHLRSGRRCPLLDDQARPVSDPWPVLRAVKRRALPSIAPELPEPPAAPSPVPEKPPVPVVSDPGWCEARFETSPEVAPVLDGCPLLRATVDKIMHTRSASRDEVISLQHSLGHLSDGVEAVNWLTDRIAGFPGNERMGSPHRGSPISCAKLRKRLKHLSTTASCDCTFPDKPGEYPNPLRHLEHRPSPRKRTPNLDELLTDVARQQARFDEAQRELDTLRRRAIASLQELPGASWEVEGGTWSVEREDGIPVLVWRGA